MSTIIRTTCPDCGDVTLGPEDVVARATTPDRHEGSYTFTCPSCGQSVTRAADDRALALLSQAGVALHTPPAEALEAKLGPPLTLDDLLDFVTALERAEDPVVFAAAGVDHVAAERHRRWFPRGR